MQAALYRDTPSVRVRDNRGLTVRQVEYNRAGTEDDRQVLITQSVFDRRGQLAATWDPRLSARRMRGETVAPNLAFRRMLSGQAIRVDSVDAGTQVELSHIAQGVLLRVDARKTRVRTEYDALGRPTAIFHTAAGLAERRMEHIEYGADPRQNNCGQVIRHDDGAGSLETGIFTITGHPLKQARRLPKALDPAASMPYETRYLYDALGHVVEQTDAMGHQRIFSHDLQGRLSAVALSLRGGPSRTLVDRIVYDATGRPCREHAGNGVVTESIHDPCSGRLVRLKSTRGQEVLQDFVYRHDPVGNIVRIEDMAQHSRHHDNSRIDPVFTYRHDALYQLIEATGRESLQAGADDGLLRNYRRNWFYDAAGNLTKMVHTAGAGSFTQEMDIGPGSNRSILRQTGMHLADAFDPNGNPLLSGPGQALHWNSFNQLDHVCTVEREQGEDDRESYFYGGDRQRVCKLRSRQSPALRHEERTIYLPGIELRKNASEELQVIKVQAGAHHVQVLHWVTAAPAGIDRDQIRYSLRDHPGSSQLETNQEGRILSREEYYPFGGTSVFTARSAIEAKYKFVRYSGKERDATGLYDFGFRYYAPWLMRWLSPDPGGTIDGLNLYRMVRNNPLRFRDGNGLQPDAIESEATASLATPEVGFSITDLYRADRGDLVYGVAQERAKYNRAIFPAFRLDARDHPPLVIDVYNNAVTGSISEANAQTIGDYFDDPRTLARKLRVPQNYQELAMNTRRGPHTFLWDKYFGIGERNRKFNIPALYRETARHYGSDEYHALHVGFGNSGVAPKLLWKRGSKLGIEITASEDSPNHLHFILDGIGMEDVVRKSGGNRQGSSITASELRYVFRNRQRLGDKVHFYRGGEEVNAPWADDPRLWAEYQPRHQGGRKAARTGARSPSVFSCLFRTR
ncbi:toxin [Xylophilus rhododendri]|uniref:Toxin n=1 Tax=Xylophilus rhododendri TaxID=2697032 RepID=A0A857J2X2_9BURK|nr:RHS repeat-associated core domain-containing protein [Xylophilus rhododendri]QHI98116.1 toxin [Xylophilus rhododendri]